MVSSARATFVSIFRRLAVCPTRRASSPSSIVTRLSFLDPWVLLRGILSLAAFLSSPHSVVSNSILVVFLFMNCVYSSLLCRFGSLVMLGVSTLMVASQETSNGRLANVASPLTMEALVQEVLQSNPEIEFYRAEIAAAKGELRTASAWPNPEASGTLGQKRVRSVGVATEGVAWSVALQQSIEWPGRIPLRKAIANRQVQLAELGLSQFQDLLASRTRLLTYTLLVAEEKAAAAREVADRFQQLREVLVQRDPAGLTPLLETRIIEATELVLKRKSVESDLAIRAAGLELNQIRGRPFDEPLKLQPVSTSFDLAPSTDVLLAAASTNHFELQMRRVELEQQGFRVLLTKKERYPAFSIGPYLAREQAGDREQQVGIGVTIPLPLWDGKQGAREGAAARRQQAESSLLTAQRDVERRVVERATVYQAKVDEMRRWHPGSVEEFRQAAALADRHYRLGAVPIATYVELQKQYLEAVEALLDTKREALEAGLELRRLTGIEFPGARVGTKESGTQESKP